MIKLVYCLRRLPNLSREEFQRYWLETHGALVRERAQALRIRRYVQVHTLEGSSTMPFARAATRLRLTTASPSCGGRASKISRRPPPRLRVGRRARSSSKTSGASLTWSGQPSGSLRSTPSWRPREVR